MPPNITLTYIHEGHTIVLRFRGLAWDASVSDPEGIRVWRKGGFRDKELAKRAAKYAIGMALGQKGPPPPVVIYDRAGKVVGEIRNAVGAGDAKLRAYSVELAHVMESYEGPEDLFAFLRRKGFTLEG